MTVPAGEVAAGAHTLTEEPLSTILLRVSGWSGDEFAGYVGNRQLTSVRGGIRKAAAAQRYVRILVDHQVERLADVAVLLRDIDRTKDVEAALAEVPGHGSGVRVSYLWMLAGDDDHVRADRMVM